MSLKKESIYSSLESLSNLMKNSSKDEIKSLNIYSEEIPEMQTFQNLSKLQPNDFQIKWSFLLFISNLYNLFSAAYFLGFEIPPSNTWLEFEIFFEGILLVDFLIRVMISKNSKSSKNFLLYEEFSLLIAAAWTLSSFPYTTFFCFFGKKTLSSLLVLRFMKLLRIPQIAQFLEALSLITYYNNLVEALKALLLIFFVHHYSAIFYLFWIRNSYPQQDLSSAEMYIDSLYWAAQTLTGIVQARTTQNNEQGKIIAICVMVSGLLLYSIIFVKLYGCITKSNEKKSERYNKKKLINNWCLKRGILQDLKDRMHSYLRFLEEKYVKQLFTTFPKEMPLSLLTEIGMFRYKNLVSRVKLFELGEPSFFISIIRVLTQEMFLPDDFVIRYGDLPECMYFINNGIVEVLATDGKSRIAVLKEGDYFGEIGILLGCCRTVSVRAVEICLLARIKKEELLEILNNFTEQKEFLIKIAKQRAKTCTPEQIDLERDLVEDDSNSSDSDSSGELESPEYYSPAEHEFKSWLLRFITVADSKSQKGVFIIDPLSQFFYLWTGAVLVAFSVFIVEVPYGIAFGTIDELLIFDILAYLIFVIDILVNYKSSYITEFKKYVQERKKISKQFFNQYFVVDLLSVIPADLIFYVFEEQTSLTYCFKLFRFLKFFRLISLISTIKRHGNVSERLVKFICYIYLLVSVGHITACLLSSLQISSTSNTYIEYLYWSFSIYSQTSYGDVGPTSSLGKIVSIILSNVSKLLHLLLYIEFAVLILEKTKVEIDFVQKLRNVSEWMNHCNLPESLKKSVKNFYLLKWKKLKGVEDENIISYFPEALSTDLKLVLYSGIMNCGLFPLEEKGALLAIIRKCKIKLVNKGVNVVNRGEIGIEMFFILEGTVKVIAQDGSLIKSLGPNNFFGEVAITDSFPRLRMATITAATNLTLAVLSMEDYKSVIAVYEDFENKVHLIAASRKNKNNGEDNIRVTCDRNSTSLDLSFSSVERKPENFEEKTVVFTTVEVEDEEVKIELRPLILRVYRDQRKVLVYLVVWAWNMFFIPLQIAFDIEYSAPFIFMETISILCYILASSYHFWLYTASQNQKITSDTKLMIFLKALYYLLLSIPMSMIVSLSNFNVSHPAIIPFSYIRITNILLVYSFFIELQTKRIHWYVVLQYLKIFTLSVTISHITGCLFITLTKPNENSWLTTLDTKDSFSIYLTSIYWSFGTLTHVTQGDIISITDNLKSYNCFLQLVSFFFCAWLFGEVTSIIRIYKSNLKTMMFTDYRHAMDFLEKKKLTKHSEKLVEYFNFVWEDSRGVLDFNAFTDLPVSVKTEIFLSRYSSVLNSSDVFLEDDCLNIGLIRSLCRFMKFNFYLLGDVILRVDDFVLDIFYILVGEVKVISFRGDSVICILKPGNLFGEANILYNTPLRTASVIATMFTYLFTISQDDLNLIFLSFPEWKNKLTSIAEERIRDSFKIPHSVEISEMRNYISDRLTGAMPFRRNRSMRTENFIMKKIAEAKEENFIDRKFNVKVIHFAFMIYSCFVLPSTIAFLKNPPIWIIATEFVYVIESLIFLFMELQSQYKKEVSFRSNLCEICKKKIIFVDIATSSPINLVIQIFNVTSLSLPIYIARGIRLICCVRIHKFLADLSIHFKAFYTQIIIFEQILFMLIFTHWIACIYRLYQDCSTDQSYFDALYFTVNIVTATGHTDAYPCKQLMMVLVCITVGISTLALAFIHGIISIVFINKEMNPVQILKNMRNKFEFVFTESVPKILKYRFEAFAKFSSALQASHGETIYKAIYNHLPLNIVDNLRYMKARHILKKIPFLKDNMNETLLKSFALSLQAEIFLPGDYLIYKDDIGDEMYFIDIGSVNIIAPDNSKIIKTLQKGDFIGEMALINNCKRICSVVARTLCLVFVLKKCDFDFIIDKFPDVLGSIKNHSEMRSRETTSVTKMLNFQYEDDEEQKRLFGHLSMYSNMASSFAVIARNQKNFSLITGMKHLKAGMCFDSFINYKKHQIAFKRRPGVAGEKRRKSEEPLGKTLIFNRFARLKLKWKEELKRREEVSDISP